jgi:hypothetical protein
MTDDERRELNAAVADAQHALRNYLRKVSPFAAVAAAAIGVFWLWIGSIHRPLATGLAAFVVAWLIGSGVVGYVRHVGAARRRAGPARAALETGQVVEEHVEAERVAVAGHGLWGAPGVGAMESAGVFYDVGDGRLYYWEAHWSHPGDEPMFPRRRLRVTWLVLGACVLDWDSSGELLRAERELPGAVLAGLVSGTLMDGTIATLEDNVERWRGRFAREAGRG